ncbi:hypothetical protein CDAR_526261 [Caerostris darwini]|uniref:Uncharacterized protein n=1 Tax=Caerostris darwini TaxID=1538125 RepID=A0AAV4R0I5_9ARAC|nr:hypothetical protein CDAR_526261 [Caerostris darwini]
MAAYFPPVIVDELLSSCRQCVMRMRQLAEKTREEIKKRKTRLTGRYQPQISGIKPEESRDDTTPIAMERRTCQYSFSEVEGRR